VWTLAEIGGRPWAVEGTDAGGRGYLLLASSLEAGATTLPVSTGMLRFMDWVAGEWAGAGGGAQEYTAGTSIPSPSGATHVRFPSGSELEIDGTRMVRGTGEAGFYRFLDNDSVISVVALNPPESESRLGTLGRDEYGQAVGTDVVAVDRAEAWDRAIYRTRQGPELWWPFLVGVLILLLIEAIMATSGQRESRRKRVEATPAIDGAD
jgi:hypothetical protein